MIKFKLSSENQNFKELTSAFELDNFPTLQDLSDEIGYNESN